MQDASPRLKMPTTVHASPLECTNRGPPESPAGARLDRYGTTDRHRPDRGDGRDDSASHASLVNQVTSTSSFRAAPHLHHDLSRRENARRKHLSNSGPGGELIF